jgi:probable F420-dependent oxidoreductase
MNQVGTVEFGIGLRRLDTVAANALEAEALGYDFVSTGEHVFFYGPIGNGLISLAAAAGATQRIKLMSTITLVPLYPPALLAKQVTSLDIVSGGRFHLGVGVGGEYAREFEACGVPVNERGARTNEALEILKRLWTEDDVSFEGRFTRLPGVTLSPKPVHKPHPPIWISGRSDAAMRRCARYGTGWLPYMYTPEKLADSLGTIVRHAADIDRTVPVAPGLFIFFAVHEDRDQAVRMASERLSVQYNQDFSRLVHRYALAGNPDDCVARLREYIDAGARTIILNSACPAEYIAANEALLAREVLPRLRPSEAQPSR